MSAVLLRGFIPDFKVLAEVKEGEKLEVSSHGHLAISGGSTGSYYQSLSRTCSLLRAASADVNSVAERIEFMTTKITQHLVSTEGIYDDVDAAKEDLDHVIVDALSNMKNILSPYQDNSEKKERLFQAMKSISLMKEDINFYHRTNKARSIFE